VQFVHKFHDYTHVIHPGFSEWRQGAGNVSVPVQTAPHLVAHFQRRPLPITHAYGGISADTAAIVWRELARQFFDGKDSGKFSGEQPGFYRHDGVTTATDGEGDNVFFSGSHREDFYGVFDTENADDCEPQWREVYEAVLTGDAEACRKMSEKHGFLGQSALRPTTDVRAGEMILLDKLLAGGYGEYIAQTPDGPFITGIGLTRTNHVPVAGAARQPAAAAPSPNYPWPAYDSISGPPAKRAKEKYETAVLIGLDLNQLAHYEMGREKPEAMTVGKLLGISTDEAKAMIAVTKAEHSAQAKALDETLAPEAPATPPELDPNFLAAQMTAGVR
jgi:hypothetical protein